MIKWIIKKYFILTSESKRIISHEQCTVNLMNDVFKNEKNIEKLVDRVTQLESTVQCLSNENQKLMGMIYSKSTVNEILKGE